MDTRKATSEERFYVVGNGPSLSRRLLAALPAGRWLGMNSAYRYWEQTGRFPSLYACVDPVVGKAQAEGIARLIERPELESLLLHEAVAEALPAACRHSPKIVWRNDFVQRNDLGVPFSALAMQKQTTGALAVRFAIARGFRNLQLLGIDCRYVEVIDEAQAVSGIELRIGQQPKENPNYFFSGYQSVGDAYQVPNPPVHSGNLHLQSFVALRNDVEASGADVRITVGSLDSLLAQHGVFDYASPFPELRIRRIGAVAVPLMARELPQLMDNLRQWTDPRTAPTLRPDIRGTRLHLLFSDTPAAADLELLRRAIEESPALDSAFDEVRLTVLPIPEALNHYVRDASTTDSPSTKSGPNCAFLAGMAQLEEYDYTLYIETDCIPIRFGWLDAAERAIEKAGEDSWIIGAGYFGPSRVWSTQRLHINGNAIYRTGDPQFKAFLRDVFRPALQHLLSTGVRSLAYDTTLSLAYACIESLPRDLAGPLFATLPRFSFTNLIENVGGSAEGADPSLVPIDRIIAAKDGTFFLHGRAALALRDAVRPRLKESFRVPPDGGRARLALHWSGTSVAGLKAHFHGYGRVDFRWEAREPTSPAPSGAISLSYIRLEALAPGTRRFEGTLLLAETMIDVASVELVFRPPQGPALRERCRVDVSGQAGHTHIRYAADLANTGDAQRVVVQVNLRSISASGMTVSHAELQEGPAKEVREAVPPTEIDACESCQEAIDGWAQTIDALARRDDKPTTGNRPMLIDWRSCRFRVVDFQPMAAGFRALLTSQREHAGAQPSNPVLSLTLGNWALDEALALDIQVALPNSGTARAKTKLRICRHGSTPWQYKDFGLRLEGNRAALRAEALPFSVRHEGYRVEIHDDGAEILDGDFELVVRASEPASRTHTGKALPRSSDALSGRRVLIIDPTPLGGTTATGQLKSLLFAGWGGSGVRQVWDRHTKTDRYAYGNPSGSSPEALADSPEPLAAHCRAFKPDVIYMRPTDDVGFMHIATSLLATLDAPAVVHIMDDWMERSRAQDAARYAELAEGLEAIIARCTAHLSISPLMSRMLAFRYGHEWTPVANGVRPADFVERPRTGSPGGPFVIRYMGGLADDMCWATVQAVASAVQALSSRCAIRFEVHTMDWYLAKARKAWAGMDAIRVDGLVAAADYAQALASADALLVAYNFDERSIAYTRYSLSNKLPECLLSGTPVLAVGPEACCTLAELAGAHDACMVVNSPDRAQLEQAIRRLMTDAGWQAGRPAAVRRLLAERFDRDTTLATFERVLAAAVSGAPVPGHAAEATPESMVEANRLFRAGELDRAFRAYVALYRATPLEMYRDNALMCLARAGLDAASFEHAARTWRPARDVARREVMASA